LVKNHSHAFFVYGVIVGLAVREALVRVLPHVLPTLIESVPPLPGDPLNQIGLEAIRLCTFLLVLIRFYIGAGVYFDRVYCGETASNFENKNYGLDFLMGTLHFIILFIWSETITGHNRFPHGMSAYVYFLGLSLLYDCLWWFLSTDYDTVGVIRRWAVLNLLTAGTCFLLLLGFDTFWGKLEKIVECFAVIPVVIMSLIDFGEMFGGRNILTSRITEWIRSSGSGHD
jgi:hypothetical protein